MQSVLATIKREHEGLATVLHVLWVLLEDVRKHGVEPDFKLFATILYYIAAFTQRFHHPKEDDYLFKLLLSRTDRADAVIDELKAEHAPGPELVGGLERARSCITRGAARSGSKILPSWWSVTPRSFSSTCAPADWETMLRSDLPTRRSRQPGRSVRRA